MLVVFATGLLAAISNPAELTEEMFDEMSFNDFHSFLKKNQRNGFYTKRNEVEVEVRVTPRTTATPTDTQETPETTLVCNLEQHKTLVQTNLSMNKEIKRLYNEISEAKKSGSKHKELLNDLQAEHDQLLCQLNKEEKEELEKPFDVMLEDRRIVAVHPTTPRTNVLSSGGVYTTIMLTDTPKKDMTANGEPIVRTIMPYNVTGRMVESGLNTQTTNSPPTPEKP